MSQSYLNYRYDGYEPEDNWGPPGMADIFLGRPELSSKVRSLIEYFKKSPSETLTKRDMIPIVDPSGYEEMTRLRQDPYVSRKYPRSYRGCEKVSLEKVGNVLSRHRKELLLVLNELGPQKGKVYLYENADIIVPVEETEAGAYVFSLHHQERKLPYATIAFALEVYVEHAEKQRQPKVLFESLKAGAEAADIYNNLPLFSSNRTNSITTDIETPDEEMDALLEEDEGLEESS
ncbi:MAG: hypothetical protein AAF959_27850 [Cyanobacteria bacterium P01_D01_bin.56]